MTNKYIVFDNDKCAYCLQIEKRRDFRGLIRLRIGAGKSEKRMRFIDHVILSWFKSVQMVDKRSAKAKGEKKTWFIFSLDMTDKEFEKAWRAMDSELIAHPVRGFKRLMR